MVDPEVPQDDAFAGDSSGEEASGASESTFR